MDRDMDEREDLRVTKTKRNIKNAFLELLSEKSISNITVQNILDLALINRATFYKYYHDKYDLAEQLSKSCLSDIAFLIEERFSYMQKMSSLEKIIQDIYAYICNNHDLIVGLWNIETAEIHLYKDMEQLLKANCFTHLTEISAINDEISRDYLSTLYASVVLTTFRWVFTQNSKVDVRKVLSDTTEFISSSVLKTIGSAKTDGIDS